MGRWEWGPEVWMSHKRRTKTVAVHMPCTWACSNWPTRCRPCESQGGVAGAQIWLPSPGAFLASKLRVEFCPGSRNQALTGWQKTA